MLYSSLTQYDPAEPSPPHSIPSLSILPFTPSHLNASLQFTSSAASLSHPLRVDPPFRLPTYRALRALPGDAIPLAAVPPGGTAARTVCCCHKQEKEFGNGRRAARAARALFPLPTPAHAATTRRR
eukprot:GHVU01122024.1.p1 GENE.GHVU01122024.1~~GHVU01122024.1.p1  ORF type:complete len:126 (-),score=6.57 GHVU01122024.1:3-380(-)